MSETPQTEQVEVDESTDEKNVFVVDPDDYQKTRKLKAINDAKDYVRKRRQDEPETAGSDEWQGIHYRTAEAVAMYGSELLPLIEDALDQGILEEDDLETEYGSLREFITFDGRIPDHEREELADPKPYIYMAFYRQLERIQRKLGLGLQLQEDKGPASI
jgi:hypothetical protein